MMKKAMLLITMGVLALYQAQAFADRCAPTFNGQPFSSVWDTDGDSVGSGGVITCYYHGTGGQYHYVPTPSGTPTDPWGQMGSSFYCEVSANACTFYNNLVGRTVQQGNSN